MKLTKEQLALIDTLMYCEGITSVANDSNSIYLLDKFGKK